MKRTFVFFSAGALVATLSAPVAAQVNCGLVNKQLQMGRSVEDVSQNLVISEDEVKNCKSSGGGAAGTAPAGPPPTGAAGSAPAGAAGSPPTGAPGSPPSGATGPAPSAH
ncbi:MAG: hypothetical protein QOD06_403 [Candidatus Binatota bacterium]|jgi:hypothetical protein|nr:hypothetical protein [Candidatus Binatota bacterium]